MALDIADITATEAARRIVEGVLTSERLVLDCLQRIEQRDDELKAWAFCDPDLALAQARAQDAMLASGMPLSPLHGVPIGIKDVIDTADQPTEYNSPIYRAPPTEERTPPPWRWRAAQGSSSSARR